MKKREDLVTSAERMMPVSPRGIPDRVPTDLHHWLMAARMAGLPFPQRIKIVLVLSSVVEAPDDEFDDDYDSR